MRVQAAVFGSSDATLTRSMVLAAAAASQQQHAKSSGAELFYCKQRPGIPTAPAMEAASS